MFKEKQNQKFQLIRVGHLHLDQQQNRFLIFFVMYLIIQRNSSTYITYIVAIQQFHLGSDNDLKVVDPFIFNKSVVIDSRTANHFENAPIKLC